MFDCVFQFKLLQFLCLFICLAIKFKELQAQLEIESKTEITFCYNSSFEGFRLNATILEVRNVTSRNACIDECLAKPCCRSVNYKHNTLYNQMSKCEFLHDLVENSSSVLEEDTIYDHLYFIKPYKVYNSSCFPKPIKHEAYASCKEAFEKTDRPATDGVYNLKETSEVYKAYCHMSNLSTQCGGGGWTLVMKLDGDKKTFEYDSSFWTNKETFNIEGGKDGLEKNETKLSSYDKTPFTKICLGMNKVNDVINWIMLNYTASSLYSVIANGHSKTNVGPAQWKSLLVNADLHLQPNCNTEGFNVEYSSFGVRIGLVSNDEDNCNSPESLIGFGIKPFELKSAVGIMQKASSGNIFTSTYNYSNQAFGYIFVQ